MGVPQDVWFINVYHGKSETWMIWGYPQETSMTGISPGPPTWLTRSVDSPVTSWDTLDLLDSYETHGWTKIAKIMLLFSQVFQLVSHLVGLNPTCYAFSCFNACLTRFETPRLCLYTTLFDTWDVGTSI
jgi:hypothetical protein